MNQREKRKEEGPDKEGRWKEGRERAGVGRTSMSFMKIKETSSLML